MRAGAPTVQGYEVLGVLGQGAFGIDFGLATIPGVLGKHPLVHRVCSLSTLLKSRQGTARSVTADRWEVSVLPPSPDQFALGVRVRRCVGSVLGRQSPGPTSAPHNTLFVSRN